jgi:hypothetical protein
VEHQVAGELEFLSHGAARRELHEEPVLRQRLEARPRRRVWGGVTVKDGRVPGAVGSADFRGGA